MILITLKVYNSFSFGPPWKQKINTFLIRHLGWLNHIIWFATIASSISKYKTYLSNCAVLISSALFPKPLLPSLIPKSKGDVTLCATISFVAHSDDKYS